MVGIVKTIDGVKKIVPLDKTLAPAMDIVPDNTIMKFSNATNSLVDTGWKEITKCDGQIRALTLGATVGCHRAIDITRSYSPNAWGTYNWECPDRDRMAIGSANQMNGYGYKQAYGFANVACPMNDSTTILLGSVNCQKAGATSGLAMGIGVFNDFGHTASPAIAIGLSNKVCGLIDMPSECATCNGIADSTVYGIANTVCSAWSHIHGSANNVSGWATINIIDPETQIGTPTKIVGTMNAFGNGNILTGAGVTAIGGNNCAFSALNSTMVGINNYVYGNSVDANYRYNQFLFGISNISRGHDTVAVGTANCVNAPAATVIGHWNTICEGAAGGLAIGNAATVYYRCGFTRSLIRTGGSGTGAGTTTATNYSTNVWIISGWGTLNDFYYAMVHGGAKEHRFTGDLKLALGATCGEFNFMNRYNGTARTEHLSGDIWFTDGSFAFQDGVEWFLAATNTHDNFLLRNAYQYINCPVEAHITLVSA